VTYLSVCQMELPRNNGRGSRRSPQSSDFGLTPRYPPAYFFLQLCFKFTIYVYTITPHKLRHGLVTEEGSHNGSVTI